MNMVGINRQPLHAFVGNAILYFMTEWKVGHKKSLEAVINLGYSSPITV